MGLIVGFIIFKVYFRYHRQILYLIENLNDVNNKYLKFKSFKIATLNPIVMGGLLYIFFFFLDLLVHKSSVVWLVNLCLQIYGYSIFLL